MADQTVQFFPTCLVNEFYPRVGFAVARVLKHLGWSMQVPADLVCCGQPAFNAGQPGEARTVAAHAVRVLDATRGPVLVPSGSCADMLRNHAPGLFEGEAAEAARRVAARVREFSQFLVEDLGVAGLGGKLKARVAYHPSCHLLRGLGVRDAPLALLRGVQGLDLVELEEAGDCCGFGGLFAETHADLSGAMMGDKLDRLQKAAPQRLVSGDLGCLMHLEGGLRRRGGETRVQHLAELLDESLA